MFGQYARWVMYMLHSRSSWIHSALLSVVEYWIHSDVLNIWYITSVDKWPLEKAFLWMVPKASLWPQPLCLCLKHSGIHKTLPESFLSLTLHTFDPTWFSLNGVLQHHHRNSEMRKSLNEWKTGMIESTLWCADCEACRVSKPFSKPWINKIHSCFHLTEFSLAIGSPYIYPWPPVPPN